MLSYDFQCLKNKKVLEVMTMDIIHKEQVVL